MFFFFGTSVVPVEKRKKTEIKQGFPRCWRRLINCFRKRSVKCFLRHSVKTDL